MSGPKTSRYTLTAEQRHILREQLERQRKMLEEQTKLKQCTLQLRALCTKLDDSLVKAEALTARTGEGLDYIRSVSELKEEAVRILNQNSDALEESNLELLKARREALENRLRQMRIAEQSLKKQTGEIKAKLKTDIERSLDEGFNVSFDDIHIKEENERLETLRQQIMDKLTALMEINSLSQEYINEAEAAKQKVSEIKDVGFLENFSALTLAPFEKKCRHYLAEINEYGEHYNDLLARYEALCDMLGRQKQGFSFSIQVVSLLEAEITRMEKELVGAEEQAYISRSIDKVMAEMGYEVLGHREVKKRSGNHFRNELYAFSEGTAVNVTFAFDGKISMELGGVDNVDRLPTEDEANRLCEDMEHFCRDFEDIEKRLSQKGIVVGNRVAMLPPAEEYAQIINAEEYDLVHEVATIAERRQSRDTKAKKVMRNE